MDKGSIILELSRDPVLPRTREGPFSITMEVTITMEGFRTTIVAPRIGMVMEEATDRTVPTNNARQEKI